MESAADVLWFFKSIGWEALEDEEIWRQRIGMHWTHDRSVMLAAVHVNGQALQFASEDLRGDAWIVMTAVQRDGIALEHAAPRLQACD
eukprot:3336459-Amphidinium_carterae.1